MDIRLVVEMFCAISSVTSKNVEDTYLKKVGCFIYATCNNHWTAENISSYRYYIIDVDLEDQVLLENVDTEPFFWSKII